MNSNPVTLLVVEDDDVDVMAIKRAFKKLKIGNPMVFARDGVEALEILQGTNGKEQLPRPYMVLLDLNMPRMNGIEFLEAIRDDQDLKKSIVFVFTTSASDEDRAKAYDKNIAGYILKNDPGRTFLESIALLDHYWKIIEFPEG